MIFFDSTRENSLNNAHGYNFYCILGQAYRISLPIEFNTVTFYDTLTAFGEISSLKEHLDFFFLLGV